MRHESGWKQCINSQGQYYDAYRIVLDLTEDKSKSTDKTAFVSYNLKLQSINGSAFTNWYIGYGLRVGETTILDVPYGFTNNPKISIGKNTTKTIAWGTAEVKKGAAGLEITAFIQTSTAAIYLPGRIDLADTFYTDAAKYTIVYDANGGTGAPEPQKFDFGVSGCIDLAVPTREGYTFNNWICASDNTTVLQPGDTIPSGFSDFTLVAQWQPNTYTVTYDGNGGSLEEGSISSETVTYGSDYCVKDNLFTRRGYKFIGWKEQHGNDWTGRIGESFLWNCDFDVVLYAQWERDTFSYVKVDGKWKPAFLWAKVEDAWYQVVAGYKKTDDGYKRF